MFDLGLSEMLVIGVVALIVVGPKDLPVLFRRVGQFVGKAKGMAREFSSAMNEAADQSGARELTADLNKTLKTATNPVGAAMDEVKNVAQSATDDLSLDAEQLAKNTAETKRMQAMAARSDAERRAREAQKALEEAREAEAAVLRETGKADT